jgi:8-oxo-dGTP pyrophosphatase MutT (NUDIX family)
MRPATDTDAFEQRAAERLRREPPPTCDLTGRQNGDHSLQPEGSPLPRPALPRPAAVLVPIVTHEDGPTVLLTERTTHLRDHSGQIAFPGGKIDDGDASALETALREAEEEIGLERRFVRPLGYLDSYLSSTGYIVLPVVGLVTPGFCLTLNTYEVADAFEVPLAFLMDAANHEIHAREWKGYIRQHYAMPFEDRYIWGITAGILRNLYVRLYDS